MGGDDYVASLIADTLGEELAEVDAAFQAAEEAGISVPMFENIDGE